MLRRGPPCRCGGKKKRAVVTQAKGFSCAARKNTVIIPATTPGNKDQVDALSAFCEPGTGRDLSFSSFKITLKERGAPTRTANNACPFKRQQLSVHQASLSVWVARGIRDRIQPAHTKWKTGPMKGKITLKTQTKRTAGREHSKKQQIYF